MFNKVIKKKSYTLDGERGLKVARYQRIIPSDNVIFKEPPVSTGLGVTLVVKTDGSRYGVASASGTRDPIPSVVDSAYIDSLVEGKVREMEERFRQEIKLADKNGYDRGRNDGYSEGVAAIQAIESLLGKIHNVILSEREETRSKAERAMATLSLEIAEAIIGEAALKSSKELLEYNLQRCLEILVGSGEVKIRINPSDYEFARENIRSFKSKDADKYVFKFEPDASISPGGCYIESSGGAIDGRIENQLEIMKENFLQIL